MLLRNLRSKSKLAFLSSTTTIVTSLIYDFRYYPKNETEPLKNKKIFIITDFINRTKKFTPAELSERKLIIKNGLAYQAATDKPLHGNNWIYVLDKKNNMYVEKQKKRYLNHPSLGAYLDVVCAGEIKIDDGIVKYLDEHSGHYRPHNRVHLMENNLKKQGATFHPCYQGAKIFSETRSSKSLIRRLIFPNLNDDAIERRQKI